MQRLAGFGRHNQRAEIVKSSGEALVFGYKLSWSGGYLVPRVGFAINSLLGHLQMVIRQKQLAVFAGVARRQFEDEAVDHVREFAPKHAEVLGEDGTRAVVRAGIERAGEYGFNASGPVHYFLDLMLALGSEFDTDPQYPWAAETLKDTSIPGQMPKVDSLYGRAKLYFDRVAGPDNQFARQALQRVQAMRASGKGLQADAATLRSIYPEKVAYFGEAGIHELIARSTSRAVERGLGQGLRQAPMH